MNIKKYISSAMLLVGLLFSTGASAQQIQDYLEIAAKNNPEIKASYSRFEAALQKAPQVSSLPDPTLTVSAFGRMVETRLGAQEARFSLMQMFPWFGKLEAEKDTAELMAEAEFQKYLAVREKVLLKVKTAYANLYQIQEIISLNKDNLNILNSYRQLALNKFEAGSAPMVNVVKVDIKRDDAHTEIELMEEELNALKNQFNYLLNRSRSEEIEIADSLIVTAQIQNLEASNLDVTGHPEIEMLEREREAYENEKIVAQKMGLPMLGLGIDYSIISKRTDANPDMNGQDAIMPMFSISLPIFRKKYRAAREEAEYRAQASEHQKEAIINEFKSEVEMASYTLNKSRRLIELYDRQIESSGQASKLLISGFSNAGSDFEEVLQMNQDILMFQVQKISAISEAYKAASRLQFLLYKKDTNENE